MQRPIRALYTEPYMQEVSGSWQSGYLAVGAPTSNALRVAGAWPTPENLFERLMAAWSKQATIRRVQMKNAASFSRPRPGWVRSLHRSRSVRWAALANDAQRLTAIHLKQVQYKRPKALIVPDVGYRKIPMNKVTALLVAIRENLDGRCSVNNSSPA